MNSFYKYIISFLIGLIIYLFFKDNLLIEGSIQDIRNKLSNEFRVPIIPSNSIVCWFT